MAIGSQELQQGEHAAPGGEATGRLAQRLSRAAAVTGAWIARQPLARFLSRSIARRILLANSLGLVILLAGVLYLGSTNVHLVQAKLDSLRVQGQIIAAAIAANATVDRGGLVVEPDKLPPAEGSLAPYRDDSFAAMELSIRPERVAPILRRLIEPTNTRARVYARDGALVSDSALLMARGRISRRALGDQAGPKPRVKNFWTRFTAWFDPSDLPIYREIGTANGTYYAEVRAALTGVASAMILLTEKSEQIVSVAVPIQRFKSVQGVIMLSTRPGEIDEILAKQRTILFYVATLAILATLIASFLLERTLAGPMRRLSAGADSVSRNISARTALPVLAGRKDEVGQLAASFATMTEALYRRAEASENFAADVAHELKNPLTAARTTAETLAYARTESQRAEMVEQIKQELHRLNRLITDVAYASRLDAELALQHREPVDLRRVIEGVLGVFRGVERDKAVEIALEVAPVAAASGAYIVHGHDGKLSQVLTNLIDNALSFAPAESTVTVRAHPIGGEVEVVVEDEGPGIPHDKIEKIFDRFYTDRPETQRTRDKNSGLGLSISRGIVLAHNGTIRAENRLDRRGARFVVRLPAWSAPAAPRGSFVGGRV
jgi:two-component system sensor histidine kinase ChvG